MTVYSLWRQRQRQVRVRVPGLVRDPVRVNTQLWVQEVRQRHGEIYSFW